MTPPTSNATPAPWRPTWPGSTPGRGPGVRPVGAGGVPRRDPRCGSPRVRWAKWEGASRPGHFDGALTVVAKLLHSACPGRRRARSRVPRLLRAEGAQQLALVKRMVEDLNFPVEMPGVPTVRSADGLALSSRNRFLSAEEREAALVLSRALRLIEDRANAHEPLELGSAQALTESQPLVELDYLEVVDPRTLEPLAENCRETPFRGEGLAIVAAKSGPSG